ncbi:Flp family type IVb pilin [Paraburkholderia adhaesiva]|uniref:Flp family type IVb pilin n=1 Tax=Paraburkholderia adhaesiva TaxID=2883244 RepID=UPI001F31B792|nr:Flp family type IVb pilin [Paraburkholderia adhaesiva]
MTFLVAALHKFSKDDAGVTAIEYGLIAALIALAIIAGVTTVGSNLSGLFSEVAASV